MIINFAYHRYRGYALGKNAAANHAGNSKKSMFNSIRDSLKKLQTDYVSADVDPCLSTMFANHITHRLISSTSTG
jgi:hypothetical protein